MSLYRDWTMFYESNNGSVHQAYPGYKNGSEARVAAARWMENTSWDSWKPTKGKTDHWTNKYGDKVWVSAA